MRPDDRQINMLAENVMIRLSDAEKADIADRIEDVCKIFGDLDICDTSEYQPMERPFYSRINVLREDIVKPADGEVKGTLSVPGIIDKESAV